jgi:hypothetical protein
LSACGRVPGQFEIVNNQVPLPGCAIGVNETIYQGSGILDVSLVRAGASSAFYVFPLLKNNLSGSSGSVDTNKIVMQSFAVDISVLSAGDDELRGLVEDAPAVDLHYKTPWSGSISSGGGLVSAAVSAFPVSLANRLKGSPLLGVSPSLLVNLQIRAFGHTTVQDIESDPFNYPVEVCSGCLVANVQPCPYTTAPANPGNECNVAQDAPVDCCMSGNDLICPPPVAR